MAYDNRARDDPHLGWRGNSLWKLSRLVISSMQEKHGAKDASRDPNAAPARRLSL
jgi:hypothetical protein